MKLKYASMLSEKPIWRLRNYDRFADESYELEKQFQSEEEAYQAASKMMAESVTTVSVGKKWRRARLSEQFDVIYVIPPVGSSVLAKHRYSPTTKE